VDKTLKIFDITGFGKRQLSFSCPTTAENKPWLLSFTSMADMINMITLPFEPGVCEWITQRSIGRPLIAVANTQSPEIYLYSTNPEIEDDLPVPKHILRLHSAPGISFSSPSSAS